MEWINVEDRLPEENKPTLVSFNGAICGTSQSVAILQLLSRHVGKNPPKDERWFVYPSHGHEIKPTHWMPLPPPPKSK